MEADSARVLIADPSAEAKLAADAALGLAEALEGYSPRRVDVYTFAISGHVREGELLGAALATSYAPTALALSGLVPATTYAVVIVEAGQNPEVALEVARIISSEMEHDAAEAADGEPVPFGSGEGLQPARTAAGEDPVLRDSVIDYYNAAVFTTAAGPQGPPQRLRVTTVSCDRDADGKGDNAFVEQIAHDVSRARDGSYLDRNSVPAYDYVAHIGDQVYADSLARSLGNASFAESLQALRGLYHTSWSRRSMRRLMRYGSHEMLPDDHDAVNNLGPSHFAPGSSGQGFAAAALRAIQEFQLQLRSTVLSTAVFVADPPTTPLDPRLHNPAAFTSHAVSGTELIMLDTRYERSTRSADDSEEDSLLGARQWAALERLTSSWENETGTAGLKNVIVFTSVPLLFPSTQLSQLADWFENERYTTHPAYAPHTVRLLELVRRLRDVVAARNGTLLLVGGDVHLFAEARVCLSGTSDDAAKAEPCIPSLMTSGITSGSAVVGSPHIALFDSFALSRIAKPSLLDPWSGARWSLLIDRVHLSNSAGIIEVGADYRMSWHGFLRPLTAFQSVVQSAVSWGPAIAVGLLGWVFFKCLRSAGRSTVKHTASSSPQPSTSALTRSRGCASDDGNVTEPDSDAGELDEAEVDAHLAKEEAELLQNGDDWSDESSDESDASSDRSSDGSSDGEESG